MAHLASSALVGLFVSTPCAKLGTQSADNSEKLHTALLCHTFTQQHSSKRDNMNYLFCLNRCFGFSLNKSSLSQFEQSLNEVLLDTSSMGNDVVIIKKGRRICGKGGALSNFPILQNKAYFEAKIQQSGDWGIGLSTSNVDLNLIPLGTDNQSWVLRQDGKIVHNNSVLHEITEQIQEGDIVGIAFDHVELKFYVNNKLIEFQVTNIKGSDIFPVVYVNNGAIIDMIFSNFTFSPPSSYDGILIEKILL